jgi:DNA replicative helicase MCM subunit Mcm2 (Cdc46/Mcm family)
MTTLQNPEELFQDFLRSYLADDELKYRKKLGHVALSGSKSLVIDFEDLIAHDAELARSILDKPDEYFEYLDRSAWAQLKIEDPEYAESIKRLRVRFRKLPEKNLLRRIGSENIGRLLLIDGIIVRSTSVKPLLIKATFQCRKCNAMTYVDQVGTLMRGPGVCAHCRSKIFEFMEKQSIFMNSQEIRIQERPEDLPPGQLPRAMDVRLLEDLVDTARPGDRVSIIGVARALQEFVGRKARLRTFDLLLDANYVEVVGKEVEVVELTPDDERLIKELAKDPFIHRKLIASLAPSIYGYGDLKEAVLYLLFGGVSKRLPDGVTIRSEINVLLVGDPGCLVADERIVLGDGTIAKIGQIGHSHLQPLKLQLLTGEGGARRAYATRYHVYRRQPVLEVITETGKSIKGTYNHPLLTLTKVRNKLVRGWHRLDELRIGDRLATITGFPCTITAYVPTGFKIQNRRLGPRFRGNLPDRVNPDLAAFLGYMVGDGWVQKYRLGFVVAEPELDILPKLLSIAHRLFKISPSIRKRILTGRKIPLHYCNIGSEDIASNLSFLKEKRIPDLILRSGNEVAAAFLRWLYEADGSVFGKGRGSRAISLKAKEIELLRDVQILLLRFGIHSRIVTDALLIRRGEDILKFHQRIGFVSRKKQSILTELATAAANFRRLHGQRSERIVRIVKHEPQDVYDIEVPQGHRFIANGIISHNTAKSQLLQYVARTAPRGLYTSGRGTTAAGLTAAVVREKSGGMVLEAGALVLADKGVACIDEIDKMRPEDRVAIHEALEQHTVSVAKGGIVATLNARAAVLAAANPSLGRYDSYRNITDNINLPVTLLSRFDLLFIMKDVPDADADSKMSEHILTLHRLKMTPEEPPLTPELLRKYIAYAKRVEPQLTEEVVVELRQFYLKMRSTSGSTESPVAITPRQLEALVRLSEARARSFLRDRVEVEDARAIIRLMMLSLEDVGIDTATNKIDIDVIMTGKPKSLRDKMQVVLSTFAELEKQLGIVQDSTLYQALSRKVDITDEEARKLVDQLVREGIIYSPKEGYLKRTAA